MNENFNYTEFLTSPWKTLLLCHFSPFVNSFPFVLWISFI